MAQDDLRASLQRNSEFPKRSARLRASATAWALTVSGGLLFLAQPALASQLFVPSIGTPDSAMNGATVGSPMTPSAAAFSNPAGLVGLEDGALSGSFGVPVGFSKVNASTPAGYDTNSEFVAFAPELGFSRETESGLRWGFSLYGSLGSTFNSNADPSVGVDHDFYSSLAISNLALMVAYPITDRLSIGASLSGMYGQSHLRYFQTVPFAFTVRGPGVQAIVGLRYLLTERISLGFSFRTPGMVWATGDSPSPLGGKQDVDLDLDMPAQIFLGLNADVTNRLRLGIAGRWTDASTFSDSIFRYEDTPQANIPFIGSASDEWRISVGADYSLTEAFNVTFGVGFADQVVPDRGVSPLLVDSDEWKITGGFAWAMPGMFRGWTLDATVGYSPTGVRDVADSEALIFPGRYTIGGQLYMIGFRTSL